MSGTASAEKAKGKTYVIGGFAQLRRSCAVRAQSKPTHVWQPDLAAEHMEADDNTPASLPPWVLLEYAHILERTFHPQQQNTVYFTNLSPASATSLMSTFDAQQSSSSASSSGSSIPPRSSYACVKESVDSLISAGVLPPKERVCLLDPKAEKTISPADSDEFDVFLFGGILGDDPPRDRTKELRKLGFPGRNLDTVQMTTDTAVYVTSLAVDHGSECTPQAGLSK
jgi:ribosome biogenesis SPOUT family RNA methylase Rps3